MSPYLFRGDHEFKLNSCLQNVVKITIKIPQLFRPPLGLPFRVNSLVMEICLKRTSGVGGCLSRVLLFLLSRRGTPLQDELSAGPIGTWFVRLARFAENSVS